MDNYLIAMQGSKRCLTQVHQALLAGIDSIFWPNDASDTTRHEPIGGCGGLLNSLVNK